MIPAPSSNRFILPTNLVQAFDSRGDGTVRWFNAPPLDTVSSSLPHSQKYLEFKKKQRQEKEKKAAAAGGAASVEAKKKETNEMMDIDHHGEDVRDAAGGNVAALEKALIGTLFVPNSLLRL